MTIRQCLAAAATTLDSRHEADLLAAIALQRTRAWLIAHDDEVLPQTALKAFRDLVEQRTTGRPIAYIAGWREFYGREFEVGDAVLIPRPETEHLVEFALGLELPARARVADIGTGSGCIALTLAAERPDWRCTGTDCSLAALRVARANRESLGLARVELLEGHALEPLEGRELDLIVSNPPYVASHDPHLQRGDVRFEPAIALSSGPDGLSMISELIEHAPGHLVPGGWLALEHGYDQAGRVRDLLGRRGFASVTSAADLAGIERITAGRWPGP